MTGQTLFRFAGALLLGMGATAIDRPRSHNEVPLARRVVPGRLATEVDGPSREIRITPGKRAMSFRIDELSSVAGMVQPNSRVDLLVVIDGGRKGRMAKLFMQNMRVLAVGSVAQRDGEGRPTNQAVATVEVTPEEGERLAIATTEGQIQLMLRGYGDPDSVQRAFRAVPERILRSDCEPQRGLVRDLLLRKNCQTFKSDSTPARKPPR